MPHEDLWERVDAALRAALDVSPGERPALLERMCGDDPEIRARVERLLASAETSASWLSPGGWAATGSVGGDPANGGEEAAAGLPSGTRFGAYEIRSLLGAGGMGTVYRAVDTRIGREVAIKLLPPGLARDDGRARRFLREARIVSRLNHPNILTIHEVDRNDHGLYIVSELVDGTTLRSLVRERGIDPAEAVDILAQAAAGLGQAHAAGILHRDIKPENLMRTVDGLVKILDFGISKALADDDLGTGSDDDLTRTGSITGTPGYIAPERLRGRPVDARADVFALGVVAYELLTGRRPFPGRTMAEVLHATLEGNAAPLSSERNDVPAALADLVHRCLQVDPAGRPRDGRAFFAELRSPSPRASVAGTRTPLPTPAAGGAGPATAVEDLVVAVLPIADRSHDPALGSASAGRILTDVFLHLLTDSHSLQVVSPFLLHEAAGRMGRGLAEAGDDPSLSRTLGREVGATAVLTGALERVPSGFAVGATVTELATGRIRRSYRAQASGWESLLAELAASVYGQRTPPTGFPAREPARSESGPIGDGAGGRADPKPAPESDPERVVERLPSQSLEAYANLVRGRDLADLGRYEEALPLLEKSVELDPELAVAWSEMGCAYYFVGDNVRGRAAHWKAAEHVDRASLKERLWINANTAWVTTENGEVYRRKLREFIDAFPDDRDGYLYAGYSLLKLDDDAERAIPWLERAYELTPGFLPATAALVEAHVRVGRPDDARGALQRYLALRTLTPEAREGALELERRLDRPPAS